MGFNSTVLVLNDRIQEIKDDPKRFVAEMISGIARMSMQDKPTDFYPGQSTVMTCEHADVVSIIAVGGNCATLLGRFGNGGAHHTREAQESILRWLVDQYGFRLVKKTNRSKKNE